MSTMALPAEELEWRDGREKVATRLLKATAGIATKPGMIAGDHASRRARGVR